MELAPLAAVLVLGVVGTGLAYLLMGTLVSRVGPTRASFITYLIPGVSLVLGVVFKDDHVAALAVVGVGLVIVGAMLAGRQERPSSPPEADLTKCACARGAAEPDVDRGASAPPAMRR